MQGALASKIRAANSTILADGDLDAAREFFASDYVVHLTDEDMKGGRGVVRRFVAMLRGAFPDIEVDVEILVEGDGRVAWQRVLRGTHRGDFQGFPATGAEIVWRDMLTSRFEQGLIAEEWAISDLAERLLRAGKHG